MCDSRVYEYLIPTYVFIPRTKSSQQQSGGNHPVNQSKSKSQNNEVNISSIEQESNSEIKQKDNSSWGTPQESRRHQVIDIPLATAEEMIEKRQYRIPSELLNYVRQCFKEYEGTHNFHNFTVGRNPKDRSCSRFIMSYEVLGSEGYLDIP